MTDPFGKPFRRLLVALDAAPENQAALDALGDLADALAQEIAGMLIEDEDLVSLAGLPFAREISRTGIRSRSIDAGGLEKSMQRAVDSIRLKLQSATRQRRLSWSLQVVRGSVTEVVTAASSPTDLVMLGPSVGARSRHAREGCRDRLAAAAHFGGALLKAPGPGWRAGPVSVVVDDLPGSARALDVARAVGRLLHAPLHLLHRAGPSPEAERGETVFDVTGTGDLIHRLDSLRRGILVVPVASAVGLCPQFERLVERAVCPILAVGGGGEATKGGNAKAS